MVLPQGLGRSPSREDQGPRLSPGFLAPPNEFQAGKGRGVSPRGAELLFGHVLPLLPLLFYAGEVRVRQPEEPGPRRDDRVRLHLRVGVWRTFRSAAGILQRVAGWPVDYGGGPASRVVCGERRGPRDRFAGLHGGHVLHVAGAGGFGERERIAFAAPAEDRSIQSGLGRDRRPRVLLRRGHDRAIRVEGSFLSPARRACRGTGPDPVAASQGKFARVASRIVASDARGLGGNPPEPATHC